MNAVIEYTPGKTIVKPEGGIAKPSQAYNAVHYVRFAVIGIVLIWAYLALPWHLHWAFLAVPLAVLLLRGAWLWVDLACVSYRFDDGERIVWSWGVLGRSTGSLEVFRVQNVTLHQSLFERLAGVGTIVLETRDTTNPFVRLVGMRRPEEFRASMTDYVQRARRARGVQEAAVN